MNPEQQAFERAIHDNPHEAMNHLAYADWLDENNQPREAAFRRSMGNWVQETIRRRDNKRLNNEEVFGPQHSYIASLAHLPEGVIGDTLPIRYYGGEEEERRADPTHAIMRHNLVQYPTYQAMETAFRRNYMENPTTQVQQYHRARRLAAIRKKLSRKGY